MWSRTGGLLAVCWIAGMSSALAQPVETQPPSDRAAENAANAVDWVERLEELRPWVKEFTEWREWSEQWLGKRQPGWFGLRARRQRPDPPEWLGGACAELVEAEGVLREACDLFDVWDEDYSRARVREQRAAERAARETPVKTRWWERTHVDLFWPMTQLGTNAYGVVGMHATIEIAGRLQVFVAPGAMLMNLPTSTGAREWKPATDWGFSYRLFDFRIPGWDRPAALHVNVAKAWILAGGPSQSSVDLAGMSVTFLKAPSVNR